MKFVTTVKYSLERPGNGISHQIRDYCVTVIVQVTDTRTRTCGNREGDECKNVSGDNSGTLPLIVYGEEKEIEYPEISSFKIMFCYY